MRFIQSATFISALLTTTAQAQVEENDVVREYFEVDADEGEENENIRYAQADGAAVPAPGDTSAPATDAAAKPGTKVLKKKKKKATADVSSAEPSVGHGAQESGMPYNSNVDLDFGYASESKTMKYSDNSFKKSTTAISFSTSYMLVFGRLEIGPKISFLSQTDKSPNASDTTKNDILKTSGLGVGAGLAFNLGNIHQDKLVPYVGTDFVKNSLTLTSTTDGSTDSAKTTSSEMRLGLGGGIKYFMGGHIALKPFVNYEMIMSGEAKTEITGTDAVVASVTGNKLSLGLGLAKYF